MADTISNLSLMVEFLLPVGVVWTLKTLSTSEYTLQGTTSHPKSMAYPTDRAN